MTCKFCVSLLCLLCLAPFTGFSAPQTMEFSEFLHEGGSLARQGEWDRSEVAFMKAAQSPLPDDRVQAYEGLSTLYKRLKLYRKAGRAEQMLNAEKAFMDKLVPQDEKYYKAYVLQWGDSYGKIAAREKISMKWLQLANGKKSLIEGKTIRIPIKRYSLVVRKDEKVLEWRRGREVMKKYPVAVGREGMDTPGGQFKITSKVKDPTWYWLKRQIPPGSPKNLVGTRWMGLDHKGYGIHGTRDPRSIGAAASHGCVRMLNRDVEELFEWVPVGTKVVIE